jgi:hypothetical protein
MKGKSFQDYLSVIKEEKNIKEIEPVEIKEEKQTKKVSSKIKKEKPKGSSFSCPVETKDVEANLKNRQKAIYDFGYGPLNPKEDNEEFWNSKTEKWRLESVEEAQKSLCGNCAAFVITKKMLNCIADGLSQGDSNKEDAWATIEAGKLGFCEALDFKCSALRTCDAWIVGGPIVDKITEDKTVS